MKFQLARDSTGPQQHKQWPFDLIHEALTLKGHHVTDRAADWAVILGWYSRHQHHKPFHQRRLKIIDQYPGRVIAIDNDPLGRPDHWRLRLGGWGYLGSRTLPLTLETRPKGDHVLIALPSRSGWNWPEDFDDQCRELEQRFPEALVRIKPGTKLGRSWPQGWRQTEGRLEEDLRRSRVVIAWTPSMAVQALIWGRERVWQSQREPEPTLRSWSHGVYSQQEIRTGLWLDYLVQVQ